jgi:nucleotide-binding universal stress UspA family protein
VEDVDLLHTAESPHAREILYPSAREAPLTRRGLEVTLRTQAERARSLLVRAAERANVPCSFRCVRGQVTPELLVAAAETDLIVMGKMGWSMGAQVRIGSTALELVESAIPVLLLSEPGTPAPLHLVIYYDASPAARRALSWAAQLAGADSGGLTVLLATGDVEKAREMQDDIERLLEGTGLRVHYRRTDPTDRTGLLTSLSQTKGGIFVLGSKEPLQKLPQLEAILRESTVAVLLLRDEAEESRVSRG